MSHTSVKEIAWQCLCPLPWTWKKTGNRFVRLAIKCHLPLALPIKRSNDKYQITRTYDVPLQPTGRHGFLLAKDYILHKKPASHIGLWRALLWNVRIQIVGNYPLLSLEYATIWIGPLWQKLSSWFFRWDFPWNEQLFVFIFKLQQAINSSYSLIPNLKRSLFSLLRPAPPTKLSSALEKIRDAKPYVTE